MVGAATIGPPAIEGFRYCIPLVGKTRDNYEAKVCRDELNGNFQLATITVGRSGVRHGSVKVFETSVQCNCVVIIAKWHEFWSNCPVLTHSRQMCLQSRMSHQYSSPKIIPF